MHAGLVHLGNIQCDDCSWGQCTQRSGTPKEFEKSPKSVSLRTPTVRPKVRKEQCLRAGQNKLNIPEGSMIKKLNLARNFQSRLKFFNLARNSQSRRLEFPTQNRAAVGCSLKMFIPARNFQSRSKSRFFDLPALWEIVAGNAPCGAPSLAPESPRKSLQSSQKRSHSTKNAFAIQ